MHKSAIRNFTLPLIYLGANIALADTITLTNGKTLEGKVVEETSDKYIIKIKQGGIRYNQEFKKSEVKDIAKEAEDAKPFKDLQDILPTGVRLSKEQYTMLIETRVKPFLASFPRFAHKSEVQKMLAQLEEELKRVTAGDVKLNGKWISADDWNANALEHDSRLAFAKMEKLAKRRRYRLAMMEYDKIQSEFRGSPAASDARDLANKILPIYSKSVSRMLANVKENIAKHKKQLQNLPTRDAARVRKAFEEKEARLEKALAKAKEDRNKWIPVNEFNASALRRLATQIKSTSRKLERPPRGHDKDSTAIYRDAWESASNGDTKNVKKHLSKLKSAGADPKYAAMVNEQLAANPAPEPVKEVRKKAPAPKPKEEPKKKKKPKKKSRDTSDDEPIEEGSSLMPIIGGVMGLALIGILVTVLLGKKKDEDEDE